MAPKNTPDSRSEDTAKERSATTAEFRDVDLDSRSGRPPLVWLLPTVAVILLVTILTSALYTIHQDRPTVPIAGMDIEVLNWMYLLALLFVATILGFRFVVSSPSIRRSLFGLLGNPIVLVCGVYALVLFVAGSVAPYVLSEPEFNALYSLQPPVWREISTVYVPECYGPVVEGQCQGTSAYLLGTNEAGEDMVIVALLGLNTTLQVAVTSAIIAVSLGIVVGIAAGYVGGRTDEFLMRYVDMQRALPAFFVYLLLLLVFDRNFQLLILVFGLLSWGGIARLVRSEVVQLRTTSYIQAARLSGANRTMIIIRHILPAVTNTILTATAILFVKFALYEGALSFLALTDQQMYSLGNQIASSIGRETADVVGGSGSPLYDWWKVPWLVYVPAGLLFSLVLSVSVVGDGIQDILDPRVD